MIYAPVQSHCVTTFTISVSSKTLIDFQWRILLLHNKCVSLFNFIYCLSNVNGMQHTLIELFHIYSTIL